jgi:hypothetical protein
MGMPAMVHGIGTLGSYFGKAHEDYGPRREPKDYGVKYGNYYVNRRSL